ncbi:MAG: type I-B CRISPR-associated protein Cas5 [Spirochaetes bacterium]|nr:MAG: type I-B CRISPR-associated protein Cas5 [Spirochaetota bacterium]
MEVLKIELEALTTSFRYPHFLVGRQPSYRMPPPATIYGHICSTWGDWVKPEHIQFSYNFTYDGNADDFEHIYKVKVGSGKFNKKAGFIKNIELELDPVLREVLLFPKLTLYINSEKLLGKFFTKFKNPHYTVLLGRSQDLASYKNVKIVDLKKSSQWYIENTLLPWSFRTRVSEGISVLMPKFIDPEDRRNVEWDRYIIIEHRVPYRRIIKYENDGTLWIDPETPEVKGMKRAVIWHSFTAEETGEINLARIKQ